VIHADRWVVLLRVVIGAWFVKAVWTKFTLAYLWDVIPYPTVSPRFLAFHPKRIAGLLTGVTALVGLFLSLNYGLASQWMSFGQQGFHVLLVTSMIILLCARAGRTWGLDRSILARSGRRWLRLVM